jgi:hypothetical protein
MLSTDLLLISALSITAINLILGITTWLNARHAQSYAAECAEWSQKSYALREPTAAIAEMSAELTELADSYHALLKSHKKLRARITMRQNRERAGAGANGELSSETDKSKLRLAAKSAGLLK